MESELKGDHITLRILSPENISEYIKQFSPEVRKFLHVTSALAELTYLHEAIKKVVAQKTFFYCIFNQSNVLVGALEIRDAEQYPGQLYAWLNERYWGTGIFQESLAVAVPVYFQWSSMAYLNAHVDIDNKRSYCALKKVGFTDVGWYNGPYGKQYDMILRKQ